MLALQGLAGNAAVATLVQRQSPADSKDLHADVVRATSKDGTAAVIWRNEKGSIAALVEFESNATLDSYLAGTASLEALITANRAVMTEQTLSATSLPMPATQDRSPASPAPTPAVGSKPVVPSAPTKKPHEPGRLAKILESAYKALRTARTLVFIATQRAAEDAKRAISTASAEVKALKKQARALQNRVAKSGGGAKVTEKLAEVEAEIVRVETLVAEQRSALQAAVATVKGEQAAAAGLLARINQLLGHQGVAQYPSKLWKFVGRFLAPQINRVVRLLLKSPSGSKFLSVLRKLQSPMVGKVLIGAAALLEGVSAYLSSKNRTQAGKVADATISGASSALVVANPVTAIADVVLPEKYKLSKMYRGGSGAVTALGEGLLTGDTSSMEEFHEASKRGEYGKVMQLSSEAGDYWAEHGVIAGLEDFGRELWDWL